MTKREYKAVLRSVIRANYWLLNPQFRTLVSLGNEDFEIAEHRLNRLPIERRTYDKYNAIVRKICDSFRPFWPYRRAFVDKLAALFAAFDESSGADSYANDFFMVKCLLGGMRGGGWKYSDTVEECTPERFTSDEERAAFEGFAWRLHAICNDLYWEFGVALSDYVRR